MDNQELLGLILQIIAIGLGAIGWSWVLVKYLVDRMDRLSDNAHKRIDVMTPKSDFDTHVATTERNFQQLREDIKASSNTFSQLLTSVSTQINGRLDSLMLNLNIRKSND